MSGTPGRALALALSLSIWSGSLPPYVLAQAKGLVPAETLPDVPLAEFEAPKDAPTAPLPLSGEERMAGLGEPLALPPSLETARRAEAFRRDLGEALRADGTGVSRTRETMSRVFEGTRPLPSGPEVDSGDALPAPRPDAPPARGPAGDPWSELAAVLGLDAAGAAAWRLATLRTLRNEPSLPFADALASSLGAAYPGSPLAGETGRELFQGRPATILRSKVHDVQLIDGKVYVGADDGLLVGTGGTFRRFRLPPVRSIAKMAGKVYAATDAGILFEQDGAWRLDAPRAAAALGEVGGRPCAFTPQGPYVRSLGKWRKAFGWPVQVQHVLRADGKTFGWGTDPGYKGIKLFRWTWLGWKRMRPGGYWDSFDRVFSFRDRVHVTVGRSLHRIEGGRRVQVAADMRWDYFSIGDNLYVLDGFGARRRLLRKEGKDWVDTGTTLARAPSSAFVSGRLAFLGTDEGLEVWPIDHGAAFKAALERIPAAVAAALPSLEPERPAPIAADEDGTLLGKAKRAILSTLGRFGLKFGGETEANADGAWPGLAAWVRESLGIELEAAAWRKEAAEVLRSEPGTPLETALARAASRAAGLAPSEAEKIEALLGDPDGLVPVLELPDDGKMLRSIVEFEGRLYAAGGQGLFALDGKAWRKEPAPGLEGRGLDWLGVIGGRLWAASRGKLYARTKAGWRTRASLPSPETITDAAKIGGKLYVSSFAGLFEIRKGRAEPMIQQLRVDGVSEIRGRVWASTVEGPLELGSGSPPAGPIEWTRFAKELEGRIYVGTDKGLFLGGGSGSSAELTGVGVVADAMSWDGRLFAATDRGLYIKNDGVWQAPQRHRRSFHHVVRLGGQVYVLGNSELLQWSPAPKGLGARWKASILASLSAEIEGAADAAGLWRKLSDWTARGTAIRIDPDAWRRETAALLRAQIDLPLERALGLGAAKAAHRGDSAASAVESFVGTNGLVKTLDLEDDGELKGAVEFEGRLYAATSLGLYVGDGTGLHLDGGLTSPLNWIGVLDGKLYAAGRNELFVHSEGKWNSAYHHPPEIAAGLVSAAFYQGKIYLASDHWVVSIEEGRAQQVLDHGVKSLSVVEGRLLGSTREGVEEIAPEQRPYGLNIDYTYFAKDISGTTYIGTNHGLFVDWFGRRLPELVDQGQILDLKEIGGTLYAAGDTGVYAKLDGKWERVASAKWTKGVLGLAGHPYVWTHGTLYRTTPGPKAWKPAILDSLASELRAQVRSAEAERAPLAGGDGGVVGRGGKTILSSLAGFASRLGGGFGFGSAPPAAPAPFGPVWNGLFRWTSAALSLTIEAREGEWRDAAASMLRNEPSLPLETVLARTFVAAHRLPPERLGPVELLFRGNLAPIEGVRGRIEHLATFGDRVFAAGPEGVFEILDRRAVRIRNQKRAADLQIKLIEDLDLRPTTEGTQIGTESSMGRYEKTADGRLLKEFPPEGLGSDWKATALSELAARPLPADAPPSEAGRPLRAAGNGIIGRAGRTIFGLGFGSAPPAPPRRRQDWPEKLAAELGLPVSGAKAEDVARETVDALRNDPALDYSQAFARALTKVHGLEGKKAAEIAGRLSGAPQRLYSDFGDIVGASMVGGKLQLATNKGMVDVDPRGATPWHDLHGVSETAEIGGRLFGVAAHGVDVHAGHNWLPSLLDKTVYHLFDWNGRPLAQAADGFHVLAGGFWQPWYSLMPLGSIRRMVRFDGKQYAVTSRGVFEERWWGWKRLFKGKAFDLASYDGRLYAAMADGLYAGGAEGWTKVDEGTTLSLAVVDGALLAGGPQGVRARQADGSWRLALSMGVQQVEADGDHAYLVGSSTVHRWDPKSAPEIIAFLDGLHRRLESPEAAESPRLELDDGKRILKGGRSIFSLFERLVPRFGFAFGSTPPGAPKEPWPVLAAWIGGSLGIRLDAAAWKLEAARELRDAPDRPLEYALARSAARLARLDPVQRDRLEQLLASSDYVSLMDVGEEGDLSGAVEFEGRVYLGGWHGLMEFDGTGWRRDNSPVFERQSVGWIGEIDGKLHAAAGERVYVRDAGGWKPAIEGAGAISDVGDVNFAAKLDRTWYVAGGRGLLVVRDGKAARLLENVDVEQVAEIGGRLLASTAAGLFAVENGAAVPVSSNANRVRFVKEFAGELYVGENLGLFKGLDRKGPKEINAGVNALVELDGRLYAATGVGVYLLEDDGWHPASKFRHRVHRIYELAGKRYFMTHTGFYLWSPPPSGLEGDWRRRALDSFGPEFEKLAARHASTPPLDQEDGSRILKGGRTIFSRLIGP